VATTQTPAAQAVADQDGLGEFQQHIHGGFRQSTLAMIGLAALGVVTAGTALVSGSTEVGLVLALFAAPFLAITLWFWRWEVRNSGDDIYVYENGIVHVNWTGVVSSFPWSAVTDIRTRRMEMSIENITVRTVHYAKLTRGDGASLVLNNRFRGVEALSMKAQIAVAAAQLPGALEALRAGQTISFDGVLVTKQGIQHGQKILPWASIVSVGMAENITSTKVTIKTSTRRRRYTRRLFPSRPFPNIMLLGALANTLGGA
jgi:hypothetical protein